MLISIPYIPSLRLVERIFSMASTSLQPDLGICHRKLSKRLKHSRGNKVTWAAGDKLCQVRLFAAEDAPCLSGVTHQEFLQIRHSGFMHTATPISTFDEPDLPPGFGPLGIEHMKSSTEACFNVVARTSWRCPQKYVLNNSWQVAAGEDSREVGIQRQRELGAVEAVYPCVTSILDSPAEPHEQLRSLEPMEPFDDNQILQIPVVPVEDDDSLDANGGVSCAPSLEGGVVRNAIACVPGTLSGSISKDAVLVSATSLSSTDTPVDPFTSNLPCSGEQSDDSLRKLPISVSPALTSSHGGHSVPIIQPDVVAAAAAAAFAAMTKAKDGSLIDQQLLIQMLSNPKLVETLSACKPSQNLNPQLRSAVSNSHGPLGTTDAQANSPSSTKITPVSNQQTNSITPNIRTSLQSTEIIAKERTPEHKKTPPLENIRQADSGATACGSVSTQHINEKETALFHPSNSKTYTAIPAEFRQPSNHRHPHSAPNAITLCRLTHYDEQHSIRLIMQHGGNNTYKTPNSLFDTTKQEGEIQWKRPHISHVMPQNVCAYHNTVRGCRNGAACMFPHVAIDERFSLDTDRLNLRKRARFESLG